MTEEQKLSDLADSCIRAVVESLDSEPFLTRAEMARAQAAVVEVLRPKAQKEKR